MKIYLFTVNNRPGARRTLAEAQACLEDRLRDNHNVSDVWWDDEVPYEARVYKNGSSHSDTAVEEDRVDFDTTGQIIWPMEVGDVPSERLDPLLPGGAEMTLSVVTDTGKLQIIRRVSQGDWDESRIRPHLITGFANNAGQALADLITSKEPK